jgi:hypothetical protein
MEKKELIVNIENVFKNEKYPGDSHIIYDNNCNYPECEMLKKLFVGKLWNEITDNTLFEVRHNISFFSKEGFKYFIPAFMIATVKEFDEMDDLPDIVVGKFTLPTEMDTALLAHNIKLYRIDKQISSIDFNEFFQNALKQNNNEIHHFIECMGSFNEIQSETIKNYLEYMVKYEDDLYRNPKIAIERYWFQF